MEGLSGVTGDNGFVGARPKRPKSLMSGERSICNKQREKLLLKAACVASTSDDQDQETPHDDMTYIADSRSSHTDQFSISPVYSTAGIRTLRSPKQRRQKSSSNSEHVCKACSKTFVSRNVLRKHLVYKHKEIDVSTVCPLVKPRCQERAKSFSCSSCSLTFSYDRNLRRHIRLHHADVGVETSRVSQYACEACSNTFVSRNVLRKHLVHKHKEIDASTVCPLVKPRCKERAKSFTCLACSLTFSIDSNLRRHVKSHHADIGLETLCPGKTCLVDKKYICNKCSKRSVSHRLLRLHIRRQHKDIDVDVVCPPKRRRLKDSTDLHACSDCSKAFLTVRSLDRHLRLEHPTTSCLRSKSYTSTMKCPVCLVTMNGFRPKIRMSALIKHLNEAHGQDLSYEHLTFQTDELFNEWLWKTERDSICSFNKSVKKQCVKNKNCEYYRCSRSRVSGHFKGTSVPRRRKLKMQGLAYAGFTCPAHIKRYRMESGASEVQFLHKHFCSSDKVKQLAHIRLNEKDRKWFAGQLASGIPAEVIIRRARLKVNGQLTRRFLITKGALRNIAVSFGINRSSHKHPDGATSVDAIVRSFSDDDKKCQGDSQIDIGSHLTDADSLLPRDFQVDTTFKTLDTITPSHMRKSDTECDTFAVFEREQEASETSNCRVIKYEMDTEQSIAQNIPLVRSEHRDAHQARNEFLECTAALLKQYRVESFLCDMIILVDDGELPAHSAILCASSPVIKSSLGLLTDMSAPYRIQFPNVKKETMELALNAVYTGRLDLDVVDQLNVQQLLDILKVDVKKMEGCGTPFNSEIKTRELSSSCICFGTPKQTCKSPDNSLLHYRSADAIENISLSSCQVYKTKQPEFNNTESSSATISKRADCTNSAVISTECPSGSKTESVMLCGDEHADKITTILNETFNKFWSTRRCPCRYCQAKTPDSAPFCVLPEVFHCDYCLYRTKEITNLYEHIKRRCKFIDNDDYSYSKFSAAVNSEFMRREPQWDGRYPCELCSEVFDDQSAVLDHVLLMHRRQKDFKCDICNKIFQRESFKQHRRFHIGEPPELCHLCGQQLAGRPALNKHVMTVHADVEYNASLQTLKCPHCMMTFTKPASMVAHMGRAHGMAYSEFDFEVMGAKLLFVCERCGAGFGSAGMLVKHQRGCKF